MVRQAIESVLSQTYDNFELIILDDNSNEETQTVLEEYRNNPKIIFYKSGVNEEDRFKRAGYAENINVGLKIMNGEFVCYLSDDDYLLPNAFEYLANYLIQHDWATVVYGRQQIMKNGVIEGLRGEDRMLPSGANGAVDHCQVMHRSSILERTGEWPTDNIRCGDAAFWIKLHKADCIFYPIQEPTCVHRYHTNELSSKLDRGEIEKEPRE
jgi:spore maturation protein CgeD